MRMLAEAGIYVIVVRSGLPHPVNPHTKLKGV